MNVQDRIKKAHISIMQDKKFCVFSGILACGKVIVTEDVPSACTNGWDVKYNPQFIEKNMPTDPELRLLILHEAMHKAYRHTHVWRHLYDTDARIANVAADYFVNLALMDTDNGVGYIKMPKVGVMPDDKYRGMSVQQIFDDIRKQGGKRGKKPKGKSGQSGKDKDKGEGKDESKDEGEGESNEGMDEHDWEGGVPPHEEEKRSDEIKRALIQGEMQRKKLVGKGSGDMDGVWNDLLQPKIDWRKVLRDFITETCVGRDEATWRKPNRRYLSMDIYMPSMQGTQMQELVIGFDTSGSCFGGEDMSRFVAEIKTIIEQIKPSKTHVIYWDTEVTGHQTFEEGQFAVHALQPKGGGGTDGAVLFNYLRAKRITPQAIVQFSDGYVGDWGKSDCPTMWALTSNLKAPYGVTINLGA
jgi:predicted metal-dependent peptidase